ncbi:colanic acid biosynthesis glycosyltransferase WcaI [Bordetella genomosp. 8]|uniref:Colanic acid biosynthesis glycosyltransferase WcaI n=1 Tax=Bordetella genomosp. 8 TaxID=1416806 RepID=A0A1W6YID0_9BORD|nr:glycosyltransferase WbuB [Bordetella genomosp. 8]ARP80778.1 colanic acid biosynthesis glycosyltransferase WcaI [Bordetella genomosp. 8]
MKIVLYGINFAPELTGTGKYTGEMAAWLAARGHDVTAITAPPYYPQWKVQPGYRAGRYATQEWQGVKVMRAPLWVPPKPGGVKRLLHLATFALSSLPLLLACGARRPDVILVVEPPLFCAPAAAAMARLCGARAWLHIQDYEVDAAFELGLLKGRALKRMVAGMERWLMRRFDRVSTISTRMLALARRKGVDESRLVLFPNWIDVAAARDGRDAFDYRGLLGIGHDDIVAVYSGNMGGKQGLETLADLARILRRRPDIHFIFCGEGHQREDLQRRCADLANVHFLPLQPAERLPALLATADMHLLPQRAGAADLVMPSKLTGMLASGRPVICGTAAGTELAHVVSLCGIIVQPENAPAMARAVLRLAASPTRRDALGRAALEYARTQLHTDTVLEKLEQQLQALVAPNAAALKTR